VIYDNGIDRRIFLFIARHDSCLLSVLFQTLGATSCVSFAVVDNKSSEPVVFCPNCRIWCLTCRPPHNGSAFRAPARPRFVAIDTRWRSSVSDRSNSKSDAEVRPWLVLLRMLDPTSLFCALAQSAGRNGVSCWLHVRTQQSTFFSTPAPESERNLTGYLQLCSRPRPQDILVRSWRRECSDVPLCSRFPTFYISRPACSISQGSNLAFTGRTLPGKLHRPITAHLRLDLCSVSPLCIRFGHVASGMYDPV
jgi:hypothetical protein